MWLSTCREAHSVVRLVRGFTQKPQDPGKALLHTRSPPAEGFPKAISPSLSPSPLPAAPGYPSQLCLGRPQFLKLCNSDNPARHLDRMAVPGYPGKRRVRLQHRSGGDYPAEVSGDKVRCSRSTRPPSGARNVAGMHFGREPREFQIEEGPR